MSNTDITFETRSCPGCGVAIEVKPWRAKKHDYRCWRCQENPERRRARERKYSKLAHVQEKHRRAALTRYHAKPHVREKHVVYTAVARAIRRGKLARQKCDVCGARPTEAHHDDYSKPLEIRWLCVACHAEHHRVLRHSEACGGVESRHAGFDDGADGKMDPARDNRLPAGVAPGPHAARLHVPTSGAWRTRPSLRHTPALLAALKDDDG